MSSFYMKRPPAKGMIQKKAPWGTYDVSEAPTSARGIFIKFGLMSTVRGIPRIFRARNKFLCILWATTLLAFLVLSFFQVYQIVDGYWSYNVKQERYVKLSRSATFPDITVCSLQPFRSKKSLIRDNVEGASSLLNDYFFDVAHRILNQSISDYMQSEFHYETGSVHWTRDNEQYYDDEYKGSNPKLDRRRRSSVFRHSNEPNHLVDDETMQNMLMTTAGLFQNIPFFQRRKLGHQKTMIDQCTYTVQTDKRLETINCTIEAFYYPQFFNCYTISLGDTEGVVVELVVNLFLDDDVSLQYPKHYTRDTDSQKHGVRVVIHEPYSYPDVQHEGHDVPPGVAANFVLKTTKKKHLVPPYGKCAHDVEPIKDMYGNRFKYRRITCEHQTIQRKINRDCHCIDPSKITDSVNLSNASLPYCLDIRFSKNVISHRLACMYDFNMNPPESYPCPKRCKHYAYSTTIDMAKWPHESFHLPMYETKRKERNVSFPHLDEVMNKLKEADSNRGETQQKIMESLVTDWLLRKNVFQRNYVSLTVCRPTFQIDYIVDVAEIDVPTLMSRIGGIMSFWLGITFVTIIEFVEVIYDAISLVLRTRKQKVKQKHRQVENCYIAENKCEENN